MYVRTVATHKSQCLPSSNSNTISNGNYAVKRWKRCHFRPPTSVCFQQFFPNNDSEKYLFWKVWIAGHQGGSRILCGNSYAVSILLPQASGTIPNFLHRKNWQWWWCNQLLELLKGPNMPQHICNGRMNIQCLHQLKQSIETNSSFWHFSKGLSEIGRVPFIIPVFWSILVFTKTWAVSWGNRLERNPGSQADFWRMKL